MSIITSLLPIAAAQILVSASPMFSTPESAGGTIISLEKPNYAAYTEDHVANAERLRQTILNTILYVRDPPANNIHALTTRANAASMQIL